MEAHIVEGKRHSPVSRSLGGLLPGLFLLAVYPSQGKKITLYILTQVTDFPGNFDSCIQNIFRVGLS